MLTQRGSHMGFNNVRDRRHEQVSIDTFPMHQRDIARAGQRNTIMSKSVFRYVGRLSGAAVIVIGSMHVSPLSALADAPSIGGFANAPGAVTITWSHPLDDDVSGFVVEQERPNVFWDTDRDKRAWTIVNLQPSTTYRYRVCAVYESDRNCSDYKSVRTMDPP